MKTTLARGDVAAALSRMADDLTAQAERLRGLDAAIGDGDLGITITLGFQAVREALPTLANADLSTLLLRVGMAFNRKAASTFGALWATMLMSAAKAAKGREALDVQALAELFAAAAEGVQARGKANLGDKTLLDALIPAAQALAAAVPAGAALADAVAQAAAAAEAGAVATTEMKSRIGRSSWFADRTVGIQDPGATAVALMVRSLSKFVAEAD